MDHASGYIETCHQVSLSAADTVKSKVKFERKASQEGVTIQSYHSDNGIFNSTDFMEHLNARNQKIDSVVLEQLIKMVLQKEQLRPWSIWLELC